MLTATAAGAAEQADPAEGDFCGPARHIKAYLVHNGVEDYLLPANVKIEKSGRVLFQDRQTSEWTPPYNGVFFASFGKYLLLKTFEQDCVDLYSARLFMISSDGSVIHQPVWTSNWTDGFFVEKGSLTYWSEWFCRDENNEREKGNSYVYVFSEARKTFKRKVVNTEVYCSRSQKLDFLTFMEAEEVGTK